MEDIPLPERVHFSFVEFGSEYAHLQEPSEQEDNTRDESVKELLDKGKSYREIASILGISKSLMGKIAAKLKSLSTAQGADTKDAVAAVDTEVPPVTREFFE